MRSEEIDECLPETTDKLTVCTSSHYLCVCVCVCVCVFVLYLDGDYCRVLLKPPPSSTIVLNPKSLRNIYSGEPLREVGATVPLISR